MNILAKTKPLDSSRIQKSQKVRVSVTYFNAQEGVVRAKVQSQNNPNVLYDVFYLTKYESCSCTCIDFERNTAPCKHIGALSLIAIQLMAGICPSQILQCT